MLLLTALLVSQAAAVPIQSEVKLPLEDYLALVQTVEAAERDAVLASERIEPVVAELISQHASITWGESFAEVTARYEVELRGTPLRSVTLPVTGLVWDAEIQPGDGASLQLMEGGLRFVASAPGGYTVSIASRAAPELADGVARLPLAALVAPVGELEIHLPESLLFHCSGAVIGEDVVQDGSRHLRFALPRGQRGVIEVRRDVTGAEAEELLAAADLMTVIELGPDGPRRHDLIVYEVSRGWIETFEVGIPTGVEIETAATDEGDVPVVMDGNRLRVDRVQKLDRQGFLRISSSPADHAVVSLGPVLPRTMVRARYLALATSVSAEAAALPERSWLRIDVGDLPEPLLGAASEFRFQAAWRLIDGTDTMAMRLDARPEASRLDALVRRRESLSLLTIENRVLHRDVFEVATGESTFRVRMSPMSTLWSVRVNDEMVRPVQRGVEMLIPLSLGASGDTERVEMISVRDQALPTRRSQLVLGLPEVDAPVLVHTWKLLLPDSHRYRFLRGELEPGNAHPDAGPVVSTFRDPSVALSASSAASISGQVADASGLVLPGVTVTSGNEATGQTRVVVTDQTGRFRIAALPTGRYSLAAELAGFQTLRYEGISLSLGEDKFFTLHLGLAGVAETVTVTAETPMTSADTVFRTSSVRSATPRRASRARIDEEQRATNAFAQEALRLRGLVGGVKPIEVAIPESGKLLALAAALPPSRVRVVLDVKPK